MFGLSWGQIAIIVMVGMFVLGPERIPVAVQWVAKTLKQARTMAAGAQAQLRSEIGPELDELRRQVADLQSLKEIQELRNLRDLNPRTMLTKNLLGDQFSGGLTGFLGLGATPGTVAGPVTASGPETPSAETPAPEKASLATPSPAIPSLEKPQVAAAHVDGAGVQQAASSEQTADPGDAAQRSGGEGGPDGSSPFIPPNPQPEVPSGPRHAAAEDTNGGDAPITGNVGNSAGGLNGWAKSAGQGDRPAVTPRPRYDVDAT